MNLGRPAMVSVSKLELVPLPQETSDNNLLALDDFESSPVLLSFFNHSAKLYEIAQDILLSFYSGNGGCGADVLDQYFIHGQSLFKLDSDLRAWYTKTPSHLRLESWKTTTNGLSQPSLEAMFRRQAVVLYLRCVPSQALCLILLCRGRPEWAP